MIDFELTSEQQLLIDTTRSFVSREMMPHEETLERTIVRKERVSDPRMRAEIDGVHASDDLSSMLSSEALAWVVPGKR